MRLRSGKEVGVLEYGAILSWSLLSRLARYLRRYVKERYFDPLKD